MKKTNFDKLLERYLKGKVSEEERIKLEAWMEVNKTDNPDDRELSPEAEEQLFLKITGKASNGSNGSRGKRGPNPMLWVMSLSIILAGVVLGLYLTGSMPRLTRDTPYGGTTKVILEDGTLVWLAEGSQLVVFERNRDGRRYAELLGSALFEVAKDPAHPFELHSGDATVEVLGTSFSVQRNTNEFSVNVFTGLVKLTLPEQDGIEVSAHERVISNGSSMHKETLHQDVMDRLTEHTEYSMRFDNVPLEDVVERIESKFDVTIRFAEGHARSCRVTADFTDHSLEQTLTMVTEVLDVEFRDENGTVMLSGSGCP